MVSTVHVRSLRRQTSEPTSVPQKHRDAARRARLTELLNVLARNVGDVGRGAKRARRQPGHPLKDKHLRLTAPKGMKDDQVSPDAALDWHIVRANRFHVLIVGAADAVEHSLAVLMPHSDPPVCWWTADTLLPSPRDVRTLVIRNVDALSDMQQRELLSWLEQTAVAPTRVISTTTVPLFQHVTAGLFLDALYYRLNTVMLCWA